MDKLMLGMAYLSNAILIGTAVYVVFFLARKTAGIKKRSYVQIVPEYFFTVYVICVGLITNVLNFNTWSLGGSHSYNLILFVREEPKLIVFNLLLFVPMGYFLPVLFQKCRSLKKILLLGILISVVIELIQYAFAGRLADIDDILTNTVGCLTGFAVFQCRQIILRKCNHGKPVGAGTYSSLIGLLAFFFGFTYRYICFGDQMLAMWGIPIWSGNQEGVISMSGIHYTLYPSIVFALYGLWLAKRHPGDWGSRVGKMITLAVSIYFTVSIFYNLIIKL